MTTKNEVIEHIRRLAAETGGKAPGRGRFELATGIRDWYPYLWLRWGDALEEAGFSRNKLNTALDSAVLLDKYAAVVRELGRVPVAGELRQRAKNDPSFPSHTVWSRFGGKIGLVAAARKHCEGRGDLADVFRLLPAPPSTGVLADEARKLPRVATDFVYLMKSGRHYKIGRSNSVGRREWELGIKIPIPPTTIHYIETDDAAGVEAYWHRRFAEKRGEGEWFNLDASDVAAFKRWKKIA